MKNAPDNDDAMFFLAIDEPNGNRSLVLEEDERTCYAYLCVDGRIVSDVWLYNLPGVPDEPTWNWENSDDLPFPNRRQNIVEGESLRLGKDNEMSCAWDQRGVNLFVDGVLAARLESDVRPGWSRLVAVDSPLGKLFSATTHD